MADPLSVIGAIGSGIGAIGSLFKPSESEEQYKYALKLQREQTHAENRRRTQMRNYLTANMPKFEDPNYQFKESDYRDVFDPMREEQGREMLGARNIAGLQGRARGGQLPEQMAKIGRKQRQDLTSTISGISRAGKKEAWEKAAQKYLWGVDQAKTMAGLQQV